MVNTDSYKMHKVWNIHRERHHFRTVDFSIFSAVLKPDLFFYHISSPDQSTLSLWIVQMTKPRGRNMSTAPGFLYLIHWFFADDFKSFQWLYFCLNFLRGLHILGRNDALKIIVALNMGLTNITTGSSFIMYLHHWQSFPYFDIIVLMYTM